MKVKRLLLVLFMLLLIPFKVNASSNIQIKSISLETKSDSVIENQEATFNDLNIQLELKLREINDYAKYKVVIENNDSKDYKVNLSSTESNNDYIEYNITYDGDSVIKANQTKDIYITTTYKKTIPDSELTNGKFKSTQNLKVAFINNPKTSNSILKVFFLVVFIFFTLLFFNQYNSKKIKVSIMILVGLLVPTIIYAAEELNLTINANIEIEKYQVVYSINNDPISIGDNLSSLDEYEEDYEDMEVDVFLEHTFQKDILTKSRVCQRINREVLCYDFDNREELEELYETAGGSCINENSIIEHREDLDIIDSPLNHNNMIQANILQKYSSCQLTTNIEMNASTDSGGYVEGIIGSCNSGGIWYCVIDEEMSRCFEAPCMH